MLLFFNQTMFSSTKQNILWVKYKHCTVVHSVCIRVSIDCTSPKPSGSISNSSVIDTMTSSFLKHVIPIDSDWSINYETGPGSHPSAFAFSPSDRNFQKWPKALSSLAANWLGNVSQWAVSICFPPWRLAWIISGSVPLPIPHPSLTRTGAPLTTLMCFTMTLGLDGCGPISGRS